MRHRGPSRPSSSPRRRPRPEAAVAALLLGVACATAGLPAPGVAESVQYWQRALKGEDEEEELDRPSVEAKIREAQRALQAQQQHAPPPTP